MLVVLDEAYREFVRVDDPLDALALVGERANVVVMRTFAKAYGLAGLRVGYLVGPEPVAAAVRACALPFGVSSVAQAAALASLDAEDELLRPGRAGWSASEPGSRPRSPHRAGTCPTLRATSSGSRLGEAAPTSLAAAEEDGIVVRPFAGDGVRVSIGEVEANDRLIALAARWRDADR